MDTISTWSLPTSMSDFISDCHTSPLYCKYNLQCYSGHCILTSTTSEWNPWILQWYGSPYLFSWLSRAAAKFCKKETATPPFCKWFKNLKFADVGSLALGRVELHPPRPLDIPPTYVTLDVVSVDVSARMGLDATDLKSVTLSTVTNELLEFTVLQSIAADISALTKYTVGYSPSTTTVSRLYPNECRKILFLFTDLTTEASQAILSFFSRQCVPSPQENKTRRFEWTKYRCAEGSDASLQPMSAA